MNKEKENKNLIAFVVPSFFKPFDEFLMSCFNLFVRPVFKVFVERFFAERWNFDAELFHSTYP